MENKKVYCDKCWFGRDIFDRCDKHTYAGESIGKKEVINADGDCKHYKPRLWEKFKDEWCSMWTGLLSRRVKNQRGGRK